MNRLRALILTALCIAGCQSLGLAPAQSFDDKLAYAYGTHSALVQSATAASDSGTLTVVESTAVLQTARQSRALLDEARAVEATNVATAGNELALAVKLLTDLQTYLQQRGVK